MHNDPDLKGFSFGELTVIKERGRTNKYGCRYWICKCSCGKTKIASGLSIIKGKYKSCGKCNSTSNKRKLPTERNIWASMISRCKNKNNKEYHNYGGRGIKVCARWNDYNNFINDMGARPARTTIDRINNDGNYEPGNCRWASHIVQNNNTRRNRRIFHNGNNLTIAELSRLYGIEYDILYSRVIGMGWTITNAINTPVKGRSKKKQSPIIENQYG